jgi:hypothetical protein
VSAPGAGQSPRAIRAAYGPRPGAATTPLHWGSDCLDWLYFRSAGEGQIRPGRPCCSRPMAALSAPPLLLATVPAQKFARGVPIDIALESLWRAAVVVVVLRWRSSC